MGAQPNLDTVGGREGCICGRAEAQCYSEEGELICQAAELFPGVTGIAGQDESDDAQATRL